jgi:outer membrane protein assembly factor BamE (lipoprotein component of BamABCDE complex)
MQARVAPRLILLLSALCATAGLAAADGYVPPTSAAFLNSVKRYPYVAPVARREKIRAGVPQMTRCMPSSEVRKLLGDPDFGYLAYKGDVVSQRIWHYILEKQARVETVPSSSVVVWFYSNGKVQTVAVHGATDIEASISRRNQECP